LQVRIPRKEKEKRKTDEEMIQKIYI